MRSLVALMIAGAAASLMTACGDKREGRSTAAPLGPSSVTATATAAGANSTSRGATLLARPGASSFVPPSGPDDVTFPGREDAFQFRTLDLENTYRDTLRRGFFSTFVNPEGSVV